eukprot:6448062-Amphidinium_carterae.1
MNKLNKRQAKQSTTRCTQRGVVQLVQNGSQGRRYGRFSNSRKPPLLMRYHPLCSGCPSSRVGL